MKTLTSFAEAASVFFGAAIKAYAGAELVLHEIGKHIEKDAKEEIGEYQPGVGPFPAWAPLADSTLNGWGGHPGKIALGYAPPDNPLLREGDLRDSIGHEVHGLEVVVGSTSEVMPYMEQGTANMPPRPVLGPAAFRAKEAMLKLTEAALLTGLVSKGAIGRMLAEAAVEKGGSSELGSDDGGA